MTSLLKKRAGGSVLGLSFEGGHVEGTLVRRTNGSVEIRKSFSVALALDPLTNDPELVGGELRRHLDAAGIRERECVVGLPLQWALTTQVRLPDLPEADLQSFIDLEAERAFPYPPEALVRGDSRVRSSAEETFATLVAIPREHAHRLEAALTAAGLKPRSFSLGITAIQSLQWADGVVALLPGRSAVAVQISDEGGVALLRTIEGVFETVGSEAQLDADLLARELRITFGQLPAELRARLRRIRVFGTGDLTEQVVEDLEDRARSWALTVESVGVFPEDALRLKVPPGTPVSPATGLAVRHLSGERPTFEFLPPKVSTWQRITERYSSRKLAWSGAIAGGIAVILGLAFAIQSVVLWKLEDRWQGMALKVTELEAIQQRIRQYRPWFDDSYRSLNVLRVLTEAFPEDGSVSAKSVEIRAPNIVICTGTARNRTALLGVRDRLSTVDEVLDVKVEQMRGGEPLEFTFNFLWSDQGGSR